MQLNKSWEENHRIKPYINNEVILENNYPSSLLKVQQKPQQIKAKNPKRKEI